MDTKTYKALLGSIKKWEEIAAGKRANRGSEDCPLCEAYLSSKNTGTICSGCPVREASGRPNCQGTPYPMFLDVSSQDGFAKTERAKTLAQSEVYFLRSLLPEVVPIDDPGGLIPGTEPVLFCSTAHMPEDIAKRLDADEEVPGFSYFKLEYGWLVWFGAKHTDNDEDSRLDRRLVPLRDAVRRRNISYVRFDCDADIIDWLPHWEW